MRYSCGAVWNLCCYSGERLARFFFHFLSLPLFPSPPSSSPGSLSFFLSLFSLQKTKQKEREKKTGKMHAKQSKRNNTTHEKKNKRENERSAERGLFHQNFNIPIQIQPQAWGTLSLVTWAQILVYTQYVRSLRLFSRFFSYTFYSPRGLLSLQPPLPPGTIQIQSLTLPPQQQISPPQSNSHSLRALRRLRSCGSAFDFDAPRMYALLPFPSLPFSTSPQKGGIPIPVLFVNCLAPEDGERDTYDIETIHPRHRMAYPPRRRIGSSVPRSGDFASVS